MPSSQFATAAILLALFLTGNTSARAADHPTTRPVVVVELFTSEGCSSCPPADAALAELSKPDAVPGVEVVPLEMHVDYWNRLGWADPFSSAQFSRRQEDAARILGLNQIYTPQMIVDGTDEFVGSDKARALWAIARSAKQSKGSLTVDVSPISGDGKSVDCRVTMRGIAMTGSARVLLAITEDDLSTDVARGENAGQKLKHGSVVRSLQELRSPDQREALEYATKVTVKLMSDWRPDQLRVVAFLQDTKSNRILAAGQRSVLPK